MVTSNRIEDAGAYYAQLTALAAEMPFLRSVDERLQTTTEVHKWIGRLFALVERVGDPMDMAALRIQTSSLSNAGLSHGAEAAIQAVLYRALGRAEAAAPASRRGHFVPVGEHFESFGAFASILSEATGSVMLIDPYLDHTSLTDFAVMAKEGVTIQLLADSSAAKPSLEPAIKKWREQYGDNRRVEARLSHPKELHDRLMILDSSKVWIVTQSFKDFSAKSPGSIQRFESDSAKLKLEAYAAIWAGARPI